MSAEAAFRGIIDQLGQAGIAFMATGSFASSYYGITRATQDIDLVIEATEAQLRALGGQLSPQHYYWDLGAALDALQHEGQFNIIDLDNGWKIDLLIRKDRPFSRAEFARRQGVEIWGVQLPVVSVEDLIVAKLEWAKLGGSERQIEDVRALLRLPERQLDRDYLDRWIRDLGLERQWEDVVPG